MDLTIADQYYLKALDYYPHDLELVVENLNYALSNDDEHAATNCLLGRVYMFKLKDYDKSGQCFYKALEGNMNFPDTYKYYSLLRIWQGEYERAMKIIDRGLSVTGMDQSVLLNHKAIIYEWTGQFEKAKRVLKKAKLLSIEKNRIDQINSDLSRVKQKSKAQKAQTRKFSKKLVAV